MVEQVSLIPRQIREVGFPVARFLSQEEQNKYIETCKNYGEKARNCLNIPIKGSNLWKVLLLDEIGIKTATLPELETALENGLDLRGTYEDSREVILRSRGDSHTPNDYVAKDLSKKLKIRRIGTPLIITNLKPVEDGDSDYGLVLAPTAETKIIPSSDFSHKNNGRHFRTINPDYSIEFDDNSNRTLYTRDNGLSRFCLGRGLDLYSDGRGLANSSADGRVVVVSGEATSQKALNDYLTNLKQKSQKQITEIQERAKKAEKYLKTGKFE